MIPETNPRYQEEETQDTRDQPRVPQGRDTGYQRPTQGTTRKRHRIPEANPRYHEEETQDTDRNRTARTLLKEDKQLSHTHKTIGTNL